MSLKCVCYSPHYDPSLKFSVIKKAGCEHVPGLLKLFSKKCVCFYVCIVYHIAGNF